MRLLKILYAKPFARLHHEDPYTHLLKFYKISSMPGALETKEEEVFQRLFPHSLIGKAKEWYIDQTKSKMINWDAFEVKFLNRFFPHNIFMEAKTTITMFSQGAIENLCEVWKRYNYMLRRCPNHSFDDLTQIHIFRNGLQQQPKLLLYDIDRGSLMSKSPNMQLRLLKEWCSLIIKENIIETNLKERMVSWN